jgi:hypothetical protein
MEGTSATNVNPMINQVGGTVAEVAFSECMSDDSNIAETLQVQRFLVTSSVAIVLSGLIYLTFWYHW